LQCLLAPSPVVGRGKWLTLIKLFGAVLDSAAGLKSDEPLDIEGGPSRATPVKAMEAVKSLEAQP